MNAVLFAVAILSLPCLTWSAIRVSQLKNSKRTVGVFNTGGIRFRRHIRILEPPCPAEWDIRPCNCTGRPGVPTMDCSAVADAAALKRIFSYGDHHHFRAVEIHHSNLESLQKDQFGVHSAVLFLLSNNKIKTVDREAFQGSSSSAELIRLDGNQLTSLPFEALSGMSTLRVVVLSNNQIQEVPSNAFPTTDSLEVIEMNNNKVKAIGKNAFSNVKGLMKLFLANNELKSIDDHAFAIDQSQFPIQINLANNSISKISPTAFSGLKLQHLDLDNNQLQTLDQQVFEPLLNDNAMISVIGNPLKCDSADLQWLLKKSSSVRDHIRGLAC